MNIFYLKFVAVIYMLAAASGLGMGLMGGFILTPHDEYCTYKSIAARINIGWIVGCELTKPRWD